MSSSTSVSYHAPPPPNRKRPFDPDSTPEYDEKWKSDILKTLKRIKDGIAIEREFQKKMSDLEFVTQDKRFLFDLEDALLKLSAYPDCTDAVFYCAVFQISAEPKYIVRYIESGQSDGFFINQGKELIAHALDTDVENILPLASYNSIDIQEKNDLLSKVVRDSGSQNKKDKRLRRPDHEYNYLLVKNATGVLSSLEKFQLLAQQKTDIVLKATVVHTVYRGHHHKVENELSYRW